MATMGTHSPSICSDMTRHQKNWFRKFTDFGAVFPFSGCSGKMEIGRECVLGYGPFDNPVRVESITPRSFTLRSLPGHIEGANKLVTFSFYVAKSGNTIMKVHATGNDNLLQKVPFAKRANRLAAAGKWRRYANAINKRYPHI